MIAEAVGGLLGIAVAVGLLWAAGQGLRAAGADDAVLAMLLVTLGTAFGSGCVRAGAAVVRVTALHVRARSLLRTGQWDELLPVARELVGESEWALGLDHPVTVHRRDALTALLLHLERFEDAAEAAEENVRSLSRTVGIDHERTAQARRRARALLQAARDPVVAEELRRTIRAPDSDSMNR